MSLRNSAPLGSWPRPLPFARRVAVNRRAFLRAGAVAIGLPFLEGLPERSAWAADQPPVFSLFIVASNGVVQDRFFPDATGPLTAAALAATDKATSVLAPHAANLLFIKGLRWPNPTPLACSHAEGLCQTLTAAPPGQTGNKAYSSGISADTLIANAVNSDGAPPLALYAGVKGFIAERISFKAGGPGQVRAADTNPYTLYAQLVGLIAQGGGGSVDPLAAQLLASRKSVNDFVRDELKSLQSSPALSAADQQRLQQHFDAIRDTEVTLGEMASTCNQSGLATTQLEALQTGFVFKSTMMEDVVKLHLELVALAFACNFNRVATLQHGDGADGTKYDVPSNAVLGNWPFHQISHRIQSDSATGMNPIAEAAHAEIDAVRMKTFLHGLDHFKSRDLLNKSFILWTNEIADGPSHSYRNVPHIIAGNAGGYLKQGAYVDVGSATNNRLLNSLIKASVRDKMPWTENFGQGEGSGELTEILA